MTNTSQPHSSQHLKEGSLTTGWLIWAIVSIYYGYQYFLRASPGVMSQELMLDFGVSAGALGILTSSYYMAYAPLQLPLGVLMDRLGPRVIVSVSALLCVLGTVLFSQATTLSLAQVGRILIGAGSACAFMSCIKVASLWLPAHRLTVATGFTMVVGTIGATSASMPLALSIEHFGWRPTLLCLAGLGLVIALCVALFVKRPPHGQDATQKASLEPISLEPIGGFFTGLKMIAGNGQSWLVGLYTLLMFSPFVIFGDIWGVPYLMQRYCVNCSTAAFPASLLYLGLAMGAPCFAWLSDTLKSRKIPMYITIFSVFTLFSIILFGPELNMSTLMVLVFLTGFSLGGQFLGFSVICELTPRQYCGTAVGFNNCICMFSGVIFQPCVGVILDLFWTGSVGDNGLRSYSLDCFHYGLSIVPLSALAAFFITLGIQETHPQHRRVN